MLSDKKKMKTMQKHRILKEQILTLSFVETMFSISLNMETCGKP